MDNPRVRKIKKDLKITKKLLRGYVLYIILGSIILTLPIVTTSGRGTSLLDSFFIATSAITTTGLVSVKTSSFNFFGQGVILALIQLGGFGYMTIGSFLLLLRGKNVGYGKLKILNQSFTLPKDFSIKKFLMNLIYYTVVIEIIAAIILYISFSKNPQGANPVWAAIFHSVSAFACAGFSLYDNNLMGYQNDMIINTVISIESLLGGLGFIVFHDITGLFKKKKMTFTSKVIITTLAILITISTIFLTYYNSAVFTPMTALFHTITAITGAGFNTIETSVISFGGATFVVLCLLMFIGAAPSGTGGGVKVTTIIAILAHFKSLILDKPPTVLGNEIPSYRIRSALATYQSYIGILAIGILVSLSTVPISSLTTPQYVFEAFSAIGTAGLSLGITDSLDATGKIVMIILMFAGRVGTKSFAFFALAIRHKDMHKYSKNEDLAT
jgi:trk system potassium uptake protein TrkH